MTSPIDYSDPGDLDSCAIAFGQECFVDQSDPGTVSLIEPAEKVASQRILVVDDEQITRLRLSRMLCDAGYEVIEAGNGRDALEKMADGRIDLVIMDITMPVMDGLMALRFMRQQYDRSDLPVIMMTASEAREQVVATFDNGANDYVGKPFDTRVALARIRNQLLVKAAQQDLRISEERYALAARGTNDGMWDWNLETGELYLSPRWRSMVGRDAENWEPRGAEWMMLIHHEDRRRVAADLESHLCGETEHFETELRMQYNSNSYRWMLCRGLAVRDASGIASRIAGSLTDITEGKVADALTGLPNRTLFHDRVQRCVEQLRRSPTKQFAVIYMDVDDFKLVNDSLGHDVGDELLIEISHRLTAALRKADSVVARLGGDEFAVLLENVDSVESAIHVAERLHEKIHAPFRLAGTEILTRGSMGIALSDASDVDSQTSESLLANADAAMYHAKKQTEKPYCVFQSAMQAVISNRLELGSELRHAIQRDELVVHFQPIVCMAKRETVGFEALVRWHHPVHGNVVPSVFVPIAESNGLIHEIGAWVLRKACLQAVEWLRVVRHEVMVSVNVSVRQLAALGFVEKVREVLEETRLPPSCLKLEVTESLLMQNPEETTELLDQLRAMGITIGIDDFGTGYSSLSYLHQIPLDVLKIDRSFVSDLTESPKHVAIIRSILALSESLNLRTIAEGVESLEQLNTLESLGCDMVQGFFLSRPVAAEETGALLSHKWSY